MTTTQDDAQVWTRFRADGRAEGRPSRGCANSWINAAYDLMQAHGITATWLPRERAEDAHAFPTQKRIEAAFPVDVTTATIALHELIHVIREQRWAGLPEWLVEMRCDETLCDLVERWPDLADDLDHVEYNRSRRLCLTYLRPAMAKGELTRAEVIENSLRPSLLSWAGEWIGIKASLARSAADDDYQMRGWPGPPV